PSPALRAVTRVASALFGIQVLLGLVLLALGHRPASGLHLLYGALLPVAVPAGVALGAREDARRQAWVLFGGCLAATPIAAPARAPAPRCPRALCGTVALPGLVLRALAPPPAPGPHPLYGALPPVAVPAGVALGAREDARRQAWVLFGGCLAATLIAARA